jgi:hypothetical protein
MKGFTSGIENAAQTFQRIQSATASTEDIPKKQLTVLKEQLLKMDDDIKARKDGNKTMTELLIEFKRGQPVKAQ